MKKELVGVGLVAAQLLQAACAVVPQNRRARIADPLMQEQDRTEEHRKRKLYTSREAAAGGDGKNAGGGCACQ